MIPEINYHKVSDLKTASEMLIQYGKDARIIAGGTDLIVDLKQGRFTVSHIIDLNDVKNVRGIFDEGNYIRIGAFTTLTEVLENQIIKTYIPVLSNAVSLMCTQQVRNIATIGGNIANASPCADIPPVLIAVDSSVLVFDGKTEKSIKLSEFYLGPRLTALKNGEIVTQILIPKYGNIVKVTYKRFNVREANALAVASVAVMLKLNSKVVEEAKIVLGAVAPIPLIAVKTSEIMLGKIPDSKLINLASKTAADESKPISDLRGSENYRRYLIEVLTRQALIELLQ